MPSPDSLAGIAVATGGLLSPSEEFSGFCAECGGPHGEPFALGAGDCRTSLLPLVKFGASQRGEPVAGLGGSTGRPGL